MEIPTNSDLLAISAANVKLVEPFCHPGNKHSETRATEPVYAMRTDGGVFDHQRLAAMRAAVDEIFTETLQTPDV